jgi:hypothetical protein
MRAQVIEVTSTNVAERTADLKIRYYSDHNAILSTETLIVPVDGLTEQEVRNRVTDQLQMKIQLEQPMPTKADVEEVALDVQVILPG